MPFIVNDPGHVAEHNRLAQALPPGFVPASADSPALTGTPTAPTPPVGDSSEALATTEFVTTAGAAFVTKAGRADLVIDAMTALAPPMSTPTVTYASGTTSTLTSPVEYKPAICGTGAAVTGWDGRNDPNFFWHSGVFETKNGAYSDLALNGSYKPGGQASYATWPTIMEFDTSAGVSVVEFSLYGSPAPAFRLEVNGMPAIADYTIAGPSTLGNGKTVVLTFPTAAVRRIRIYLDGTQGVVAVRVPTGQSITKPSITRRTGVVLGDSYVNGAGSVISAPVAGASNFDTFALRILKALGCNDFVLAGIGGTGFVNGATASPPSNFAARVATVLGMTPAVLVVNGSINDGEPGTGLAAAVDDFLASTSAISQRYVIGTMRAGYPTNYATVKAAAAANGVPFVNMQNFLDSTNPSCAALMYSDGVHPSFAGHRAIERAIYRQIG